MSVALMIGAESAQTSLLIVMVCASHGYGSLIRTVLGRASGFLLVTAQSHTVLWQASPGGREIPS